MTEALAQSEPAREALIFRENSVRIQWEELKHRLSAHTHSRFGG
jgi:hypothetical protein